MLAYQHLENKTSGGGNHNEYFTTGPAQDQGIPQGAKPQLLVSVLSYMKGVEISVGVNWLIVLVMDDSCSI